MKRIAVLGAGMVGSAIAADLSIDVTAALLFPQWRLAQGEPEFTAMHITVQGEENGEDVVYSYRLFDRYDAATDTSSMARTTGYTCTALARLILNGQYREPGIRAPERVAAVDGSFEYVVAELAKRGVHLALVDRVCGLLAGHTEPEHLEVGTGPWKPPG